MLVTYVVYNDDETINKIGDALKVSPIFHFIDYRTKKGKKDAWKIMNYVAAREVPFAIVYDDDKIVKAFYTEADNNIIKSLIEFLNENCLFSK